MYSTHNEGKSIVAERFISTLKTKIYKYMTSISINVYIDKLNNILNEYNNIIIEQLKWSLLILKRSTYIVFDKEVKDIYPKFKVGDHVRISKYKNILLQIGLKRFLWLKKLK